MGLRNAAWERLSKLENAAPNTDRDGMSPVVCLKFFHDVLDVRPDGFLTNEHDPCDIFVAIPTCQVA